jgi:hypothetical protein
MRSDDVRLCAFASSAAGGRLLDAFGLHKYREGVASQDGWPLHLLTAASAAEIEAALPRFLMARSHATTAEPGSRRR